MISRSDFRKARRHKRDILILSTLLFIALCLIGSYFWLNISEKSDFVGSLTTLFSKKKQTLELQPQFKKSQMVKLSKFENKEYKDIKNKVGIILKSTVKDDSVTYTVKFSDTQIIKGILESDVSLVTPAIAFDQKVAYLYGDFNDKGIVTSIEMVPETMDVFRYAVRFSDGRTMSDLDLSELVFLYDVPLRESYGSQDNNQILRETFTLVENYAYSILNFPKGRFKIGSQEPDKDYLILPSNVELNGHDTTLVVSGTAYWFGLATGVESTEGLSQFTMRNLSFEAADLVNGNHFMLMANHGTDWLIEDNRFTMVHQSKSHLFDLGGVYNVVFQRNQFIGFAPDLTSVDKLSEDIDLHAVYSETIQLDSSDTSAVWDAGLIKRLDPDYDSHNAVKQFSHNIIIRGNAFLPYRNTQGQIVAYSGTVGQHSSDVGYVEVVNNLFEDSLVLRYPESQTNWVLKPIHFSPQSFVYVEGNSIQ